jgi:hypothetical protein
MFNRIRQFFEKLMHISEAVQNVGTAADSIQSIAQQKSIKDTVNAAAQATKDVTNAVDAVQEAKG